MAMGAWEWGVLTGGAVELGIGEEGKNRGNYLGREKTYDFSSIFKFLKLFINPHM
jgi:hypothetical protein